MPAKKTEHKPSVNAAFLTIAINKTSRFTEVRFAQRSIINMNAKSVFQTAK